MSPSQPTNSGTEVRTSLFGFPEMAENGVVTVTQNYRWIEIRFEYERGENFTLTFHDISGYRYRHQDYIGEWHIINTTDQMVEITNSNWVAQMIAESHLPVAPKREMRHFMFVATDHGCYEVLAARYETAGAKVLPPDDDE